MYDIAIIGASLSGSYLALSLSGKGFSVALVDKSSFPRRKACGEGLSARGLKLLENIGLAEKVLTSRHKPFYGYDLATKHGKVEISFANLNSYGKGIGISRNVLDLLLLEEASKRSDIHLHQRLEIREINKSSLGYEVKGKGGKLMARRLVLAEGANGFLASKLKVPLNKRASDRYGLSMQLEGGYSYDSKNVIVVIRDGFEITLTPISDGEVNVCFLGGKQIISKAAKGEFDALLYRSLREFLGFEGSLTGAPIGVGPIGSRAKCSFFGDIALIGDSAETLDPLGGMGMSHALLSAHIAGKEIFEALCGKIPYQEALLAYDRKRKAAVRELRGFTRLTTFTIRRLCQHGFIRYMHKNPLFRSVGEVANHTVSNQSFMALVSKILLASSGAL